MKKIKFCITACLLLTTVAFAQGKKNLPPPPAHELKAVAPSRVTKPEAPLKEATAIPYEPAKPAAPPLPSEIKGHPWTRNGQNVWVMKHSKPVQPPKPPKPPMPPPPPPKQIEL